VTCPKTKFHKRSSALLIMAKWAAAADGAEQRHGESETFLSQFSIFMS
jgi:hypothetical protein